MNILKPFKNRQKEVLRVQKAKASRAIFESEEVQRIDVTLLVEGDNLLKLEFTAETARALIQQMSASYEAMRPPLRHNTSAADWMGME